jgi:hypothetical protein
VKIALYIEDGLEQVVLTPESDTEKGILGKMHDGSRDLSVLRGAFYECRGGWVREGLNNDSTMVVLRPAKPKPASLSLPELAALARRAVENTTPRFLGNDNRALEIAQHFQNDIANAVYAEIISAGPAPVEES